MVGPLRKLMVALPVLVEYASVGALGACILIWVWGTKLLASSLVLLILAKVSL